MAMNNEKRGPETNREVQNGTERQERRFDRSGFSRSRRDFRDDVNRQNARRPYSPRFGDSGRRSEQEGDDRMGSVRPFRRFSRENPQDRREGGNNGERNFRRFSRNDDGERRFDRGERNFRDGGFRENGDFRENREFRGTDRRENRTFRSYRDGDSRNFRGRDGRGEERDTRRYTGMGNRDERRLEKVNGDGFVPKEGFQSKGGYMGFKSRSRSLSDDRGGSTGDRIRRAYEDNSDRVYSKKKQIEYKNTNPFADGEKIRLNRYIAISGICSRREADELIQRGDVTVNGEVVTTLGVKVDRKDIVEVSGKIAVPERKVYILLNKPKDFVTTVDDPQERKTVMNLIEGACKERVYPVGRLDRQTTGVLLFTNDGDLAKKLTHPSYEHKKVYHVFLDKPLALEDFQKISEGVELEDGEVAADEIQYTSADRKEVGIEIHSGKNRIVRRIFEHLGYDIEKLDRVYFAGLTKKDLPRGRWRFLTPQEVNYIKNFNV